MRARRPVLVALVLVASLAMASEASADTSNNIGGSNDWNSGLSWDCGHVPGPGDSALVGSGDDPGVATTPIPARGPLKVRVANANGFAITGRLEGETIKRVAGAPRRRVKLPARAFRAAARTRKTVALRLPRTLRNLLRSRGRLALRITANVTDPVGQRRVVKRRLTPKLRTR